VDGDARTNVDDRDHPEASHARAFRSTATVLIHEWVTGGGLSGRPLPRSWADEGGAIRRALVAEFAALQGVRVVFTIDPRFAASPPPGCEQVPLAEGHESALGRLFRSHDFTLVIAPETGGVLERLAHLIDDSGGRSLGSTPAAVRLTADKLRLAEHLKRSGVRTPPTSSHTPGSAMPGGFPFPVVVKPRDGAGSVRTSVCRSQDEVDALTGPNGELVVQPYSRGEAMSASFLVGADGEPLLLAVGWQDVEAVDGSLRYLGGRLPAPPFLADGPPRDAVRSVSGLRGWVGVDFVHDPVNASCTVIEINPRPTTSVIGVTHLFPRGAISQAWLGLVTGGNPELPEPTVARDGTIRFLADGRVVPRGRRVP
jgi:predicted ATP-grasp superfamily ATP-dependent carboligase